MAVLASVWHIQQHTRWQCVPLYVIFNSMRDDSVCLCMLFSISYKMAASVCLCMSYSTAYKMDVFASLCYYSTSCKMTVCTSRCHIQDHTIWQCVPLYVSFNSMRDVCEMAVFCLCYIQQHTRWVCLPLCVIIQHHARWQCVPLDVTFNIIQYGSVYLFMSACEMAVFCFCLLYLTASKMAVFASLCNYSTSCKVTVLASLCRIRHDITWQRLPQSLCHIQHHTKR